VEVAKAAEAAEEAVFLDFLEKFSFFLHILAFLENSFFGKFWIFCRSRYI
jgi:hypothetical protein